MFKPITIHRLLILIFIVLFLLKSSSNSDSIKENTKAKSKHEETIKNITLTADEFQHDKFIIINHTHYATEEFIEEERLASAGSAVLINTIIVIILVIFAGLMSGLTVGYLSIDELFLELKVMGGTPEEKETALIIQQVLHSKHRLLVTLLVSNAFAMEALPVFLGKLVPEWAAIIVSTTLVLFIGEVIPQAICTGPKQLEIAAAVAPSTNWLIWILTPINIPLGKMLDVMLGVHSKNRYMNTDLRSLIELHTYSSLKKLNLLHEEKRKEMEKKKDMSINEVDDSRRKVKGNTYEDNNFQSSIVTTSHELLDGDIGLNEEQANLMISAIEMKEKKAIEVMIPISKTFMISYDDPIDHEKLSCILERGFSRIPVYANSNPNDIIGLVRIKQLIGIDLSERKTMRESGIQLKKPLIIPPKLNLLDLLREFKKGKSHMAFITEQVKELQIKLGVSDKLFKKTSKDLFIKGVDIKVLGIVTLEDVIEKMINTEIYDEDDYEDMNNQRMMAKKESSSNALRNKLLTSSLSREIIKENTQKLNSIISESLRKKSFFNHYAGGNSEIDLPDSLRNKLI